MASVLEEDNVFVVDNTVNGFDLHSFDTGSYIRTFPTAHVSKDRRTPRHVCFGENGQIVVGGGNDGKIYVFDRRCGATLDTMQHASEQLESQTITVSFFRKVKISLMAADIHKRWGSLHSQCFIRGSGRLANLSMEILAAPIERGTPRIPTSEQKF